MMQYESQVIRDSVDNSDESTLGAKTDVAVWGARVPKAAATVSVAPAGDALDVAEFIDSQPVGRFQIGLLLVCAAVLFIDGFDTQAIGYVAPALAREWNLPRGALGPVFSAGLFGLMIGALIFGPVADRIGLQDNHRVRHCGHHLASARCSRFSRKMFTG